MVNDALLRVKNIKIEESRNFESKLKQWKTVERVAICGTNIIPSNYMNHIRSAFINSDITDLTPLVDEWRRIKANWEIDRMKMAAEFQIMPF